jgi:hypothetical protein
LPCLFWRGSRLACSRLAIVDRSADMVRRVAELKQREGYEDRKDESAARAGDKTLAAAINKESVRAHCLYTSPRMPSHGHLSSMAIRSTLATASLHLNEPHQRFRSRVCTWKKTDLMGHRSRPVHSSGNVLESSDMFLPWPATARTMQDMEMQICSCVAIGSLWP